MTEKFQTWAEWPTLVVLVLCYGAFFGAAIYLYPVAPLLAAPVMILAAALHSSLSHEMLHGHPFKSPVLNAALVFPALSFFIPYLRFKDTHLAHHQDENLTDPYDDPESNYLDPAVWRRLPGGIRVILLANNTLLGRMILGPMISQLRFMVCDARDIVRGNMRVAMAWALHVPAVLCVVIPLQMYSEVSVPLWIALAYGSLSILKIRTFLEHRAYGAHAGRTVVIQDRGILAFLFLNNNFHAVHHSHPKVPWFDLPRHFTTHSQSVLDQNHGYYFANYRHIFAKYLLRAKDPVAHPLWSDRSE